MTDFQNVWHIADGLLSGVQVLIATAITGIVQAVIGGQPLLIIGVAEPIVLIYSFMYSFAKGACPASSIVSKNLHRAAQSFPCRTLVTCDVVLTGQGGLGPELFLAWAAWVCIWTAAIILALSCANICNYVSRYALAPSHVSRPYYFCVSHIETFHVTCRFTRLSGELFGFLIAVLFMQQAIRGTRLEFLPVDGPHTQGLAL